MSHEATICRIRSLHKHPNADRLQIGSALGYNVILGLDTQEGELGLFFEADTQLSEIYAKKNNLIEIKDPAGHKIGGGYLSEKCRIRTQRLRGELSEGLWMPLSSLTGVVSNKTIGDLKDGATFHSLENIEICRKYVTEATKKHLSGNNKKRKLSPKLKLKTQLQFPEHIDTKHLRKEIHRIPDQSTVIITEKLDGTSARIGNCSVETIPISFWNRLKFAISNKQRESFETRIGTRRTVVSENSQGYYGTNDFRVDICKDWIDKLVPREIVFGEIVGFLPTGKPIQPPGTMKILGKAFVKEYGEVMDFAYGCAPNQCKFYCYRIAYTLNREHLLDLPWESVKSRCNELGINYVPEISTQIYKVDEQHNFLGMIKHMCSGSSLLDPKTMKEGVCIRIEPNKGFSGPFILKEKSSEFKILREKNKENEQYIDIEEDTGAEKLITAT